MYAASAQYINAIKADTVELEWNGTINTVGGNTYTFSKDDIAPDSGTIVRTISNQSLKLGTVFSSTLSIELILQGVSRYELYGATVEVKNTVIGALDEIPMGSFTVINAKQSADYISITASDAMIKFSEVNFSPALNNTIQDPYAWLLDMCSACGVTFGMTSAQVEALPNGQRKTGFADVVTDVKTWRDVLSYLSTYLGSFAYIGRDGLLYLGQYMAGSSDTVTQYLRYSSGLSDFRTTYDGLYAIYKEEGVQEYVSNNNSGGLVLDIGTNPFLQFSDSSNRQAALQEIIDAWNGVYYVPYQSEMGIMPIYDPGDVLTFTGMQADVYDYGAITQITYNFNGKMTVVCTGDNPYLAEAQDRFSKTVAGLSSDYNNGQQIGSKDFWLLHTTNTDTITVESTKTQVAEIEFQQTVDVQRMGFMFTCDGSLTATAKVDVEISVDDNANYTFEVTEEKSLLGKRPYNATCGFDVDGKGLHTAKVYLTVTDKPLLWGDLA